MHFDDHPAAGHLPPGGLGGLDGLGDEPPLLADTDADGSLDTLVVSGAGEVGGTVLLTDVDADGTADIATAIGADGAVTVAQRSGDGGWVVLERGDLGTDRPSADGALGHSSAGSGAAGVGSTGPGGAQPAVVVDPVSGEWTELAEPGGAAHAATPDGHRGGAAWHG